MAYSALARKWRPKSFSELKGQSFVTTALGNALSQNKLHHAYLLTGTRGVGKTTLARIFAKALNCEKGIVKEPCNQCQACLDIDAGRFLDLIEVDAASKTRVEETRDLLDNVIYAPAQGRFKIYLIDEVHMLSGHSFNALLKTLEEPPAHVKFIFATTDPERIPVTVLSRCLNFNLRAMSQADIEEQLSFILQEEGASFEAPALALLAVAAKGSMRDSLSLLEQALSYGMGKVALETVQSMLGLQFQQHIPALLQAVFAQDTDKALTVAKDIAAIGAHFETVLETVIDAIYALSVQSMARAPENLLSNIDENILALETPEPEVLQLLYQIALMGKKDMAYSPSPQVGFEMTLLRMVAFSPKEHQAKPSLESQQRQAVPSSARPSPAQSPANVIEKKEVAKQKTSDAPRAPVLEKPAKDPTIKEGADNWAKIVHALPLSGLTKVMLQHCALKSWQGQKISLVLDPAQEACFNKNRQAQIQEALAQYLGHPVVIDIACGTETDLGQTPIEQAKAMKEKANLAAEKSLRQDEKVQSLLDTFGATIEKISTSDS